MGKVSKGCAPAGWIRGRTDDPSGRASRAPRAKGTRFSADGARVESTGALQRMRHVVVLTPDSTEGERGHWLEKARRAGCYVRVRGKPTGELPPACEEYGRPVLTEVQRITSGRWPDVYELEANAAVMLALHDRIVADCYVPVAVRLPTIGQGGSPAQATERKAYREMMADRGRYGAEQSMRVDRERERIVSERIEETELSLALAEMMARHERTLRLVEEMAPGRLEAARMVCAAQEQALRDSFRRPKLERELANAVAVGEFKAIEQYGEPCRVDHAESKTIRQREEKRKKKLEAKERKNEPRPVKASGRERLERKRQELAASAERMKQAIREREGIPAYVPTSDDSDSRSYAEVMTALRQEHGYDDDSARLS